MSLDLQQPEVIITHDADLDGLTSGLLLVRLAKKLFDADVPLQAWGYEGLTRRPMGEKTAWVCDLNFDKRMDKPGWLIVDHHETPAAPENAQFIHDTSKSAGTLCYELCQEHEIASPELDRLMHLNDVADLYREDDPDFTLATDYAQLVKSYGFWNFKAVIDDRIEAILDHPLLAIIEAKRKIETPIGRDWSKKKVEAITPDLGYVPISVGNINAIVHDLLLDDDIPYKVLMTAFKKAKGPVLVSFRSRNGEALPIARKLQGGGHPNACGATLPGSVRNVGEALGHLKHTLNPKPKKEAPLNNLESLFDGIDVE